MASRRGKRQKGRVKRARTGEIGNPQMSTSSRKEFPQFIWNCLHGPVGGVQWDVRPGLRAIRKCPEFASSIQQLVLRRFLDTSQLGVVKRRWATDAGHRSDIF